MKRKEKQRLLLRLQTNRVIMTVLKTWQRASLKKNIQTHPLTVKCKILYCMHDYSIRISEKTYLGWGQNTPNPLCKIAVILKALFCLLRQFFFYTVLMFNSVPNPVANIVSMQPAVLMSNSV